MARDEIAVIVEKVVLDTAEAGRAARAHAKRLDELTAATKRVAQAEKQTEAAQRALREETLKLRREQLAATTEKKELARRAAMVRLELSQQAEAARQARAAQKALRDEQRALSAEMRNTGRGAREAARAGGAAARESEASARRIAAANASADRSAARLGAVFERSAAARRAREMSRLNTSIGERRTEIGKLEGRLEEARGQSVGGVLRRRFAESTTNEATIDNVGRFASGVGAAGRAAVGTATGLVGLGAGAVAGIANIGGEFERIRASLETIEGSKSGAEAAFKTIQDFARTTPNGLQETTEAFIKLRARGLDASIPALQSYGDTAAAMGKTLNDAIEAVADATTGEFERLKEFGIKASTEGDKVKLTFKGITTTVQKDSKAIEQYLIQLGQTNFGGGMERQSKTLGGVFSNLSDTVSQLADTAFQSGLGDALKEVIADMTGAAGEGEHFAKVVGETLGGAVRDAYAAVKDFIGPVDDPAPKFKAAFDTARTFVGTVVSAAGKIASFAAAIGGTTTAVIGLSAAFVALTGPLGAAAVAGAALGAGLTAALLGVRSLAREVADDILGIDRGLERAIELSQRIEREKQLKQLREERETVGNAIQQQAARSARAQDLSSKVQAAELRKRGVSKLSDLSAKDQQAVLRAANNAAAIADSSDFDRQAGAVEADIAGRERSADAAEFSRLKKKKGLSPAERKRLNELSTKLDIAARDPKAAKEKLDAFDAERKKELDELVRKAELRGGDEALQRGDIAGASKAARTAGVETRARLEGQMRRGVALPGEVERSLLRAAGFEDVKNAPPPPVVVYQQQFTFDVVVELTADIVTQGDADSVGGEIAGSIETHLETDVLPRAYESFRTTIRR